jgi:hypothetical protein
MKKPASKLQAPIMKGSAQAPQVSFNVPVQDAFIQSHGVSWVHYKAIPSPIGLKDRGEYRRSDAIDTISSNGFIYKKCGVFTGVMMGNSKKHAEGEGGMIDQSTARLTLPRFYDADSDVNAGERIYLAPGDRLYIKDLETNVVSYQRVDYNPHGNDFLQYPAIKVEFAIDSKGKDYKCGSDFKVDKFGNIQWLKGKKNPGIDPDTGKGRVYSIRYHYQAFYYIANLINEVRVVNTTDNGIRTPTRMPYHCMIQREYVYHNQTNDGTNENKIAPEERGQEKQENRVVPKSLEEIDPNQQLFKVNVNNFE